MSRSDLLNAGKALGLALLPLGLGLQPAGAARALTQDENNVIRMFQRNKSSVVFITNLTLRRDAYTMNQMEIPQGAGSGIVWPSSSSSSSSSSSTSSPAADGTIVVTNYHVVRGSNELMVKLNEGEEAPATIVGVDEDTALVGGPDRWEVVGRQSVWVLTSDGRTEHPAGSVLTT